MCATVGGIADKVALSVNTTGLRGSAEEKKTLCGPTPSPAWCGTFHRQAHIINTSASNVDRCR